MLDRISLELDNQTNRPQPNDLLAPTNAPFVVEPFALPNFGDDAWPLRFWIGRPTTDVNTIYWQKFPSEFRESLRLAAWSLLNNPVPVEFRSEYAPKMRGLLGSSSYYRDVMTWRVFAEFCIVQGVSKLWDITSEVLEEFAYRYSAQDSSSARKRLTAITRLWIHLNLLEERAFPEPPWVRGDIREFTPRPKPTGENYTRPIPSNILGPLLSNSLKLLRDSAQSIVAIDREVQRVETAPPPIVRAGKGVQARLMDEYEARLAKERRTIPVMDWRGRRVIDAQWVAFESGCTMDYVKHWVHRSGRGDVLRAQGTPAVLKSLFVFRDENGDMRQRLVNREEARLLPGCLEAACAVVISYLTGMRPGEVLGLEKGCLRQGDSEQVNWMLIDAVTTKTVRDEHGHHDPRGEVRDVPWVAIQPVQQAVGVLTRWRNQNLLFPGPRPATSAPRAMPDETANERIRSLVTWINAQSSVDFSPVPIEPVGQIMLSRFRRTLAWHVANQPGGLVALAIQYGHIYTLVTESYVNRSQSGLRELIDQETAHASARHIADAVAKRQQGERVSGPAAKRLIATLDQVRQSSFKGAGMTPRQLRDVKEDPAIQVFDGWSFTCLMDPALARCKQVEEHKSSDEAGVPRASRPLIHKCQEGCQNLSRTDSQAVHLRELAESALSDVASNAYPAPLAEEMRDRALKQLSEVEEHFRVSI